MSVILRLDNNCEGTADTDSTLIKVNIPNTFYRD
jgi:hypothetical protein